MSEEQTFVTWAFMESQFEQCPLKMGVPVLCGANLESWGDRDSLRHLSDPCLFRKPLGAAMHRTLSNMA